MELEKRIDISPTVNNIMEQHEEFEKIPEKITLNTIIMDSRYYEDEVEICLGDYEIEIRDDKIYAVKKKTKYPKNFDSCCDILNIDISRTIEHSEEHPFYRELTSYENDLLSRLSYFRKLLICRDAYWKIAGEELGLGKPWEPDFSDDSPKYNIFRYENEIILSDNNWSSRILAFPTKEMRNAFYDNFKNLIEQCKVLL